MIMTRIKTLAEDENNEPTFMADIYQVGMIAAFAIAILFMFLGNTVPIEGKSENPAEKKNRSLVKLNEADNVEIKEVSQDLKESTEEIKKALPEKENTLKKEKSNVKKAKEQPQLLGEPSSKNSKNDKEILTEERNTPNLEKKVQPENHDRKETFSLVFENNDAIYDLMNREKIKLFVLLPETGLQYQAVPSNVKSGFKFKLLQLNINDSAYELLGNSVPSELISSFIDFSKGLSQKKLIYIIQAEQNLDRKFKDALAKVNGVYLITKDERIIKKS